jgi:hypothetical protein
VTGFFSPQLGDIVDDLTELALTPLARVEHRDLLHGDHLNV